MQNDKLFAPPTDEEAASVQAPPQQTPQEPVAQAPDLFAAPTPDEEQIFRPPDSEASGVYSQELAADLPAGELTVGGAFNNLAAVDQYMENRGGWNSESWFSKTLNLLTVPEQMVARQMVNVMENSGHLTTDQAKDLISRDAVHHSDYINIMWDKNFGAPESFMAKTGKFVTGLAADILLDPLTLIGIGGLTQSAKAVTVGGRTIRNLDKASTFERYYLNTLGKVEKIVTSEGAIKDVAGMSKADIVSANKISIAQAVDEKAGFDGMLKTMNLTPEAKAAAIETAQSGMTKSSWLKEWQEGQRGLKFRIGVPWTKLMFETDIPSKWIGDISMGFGDALSGGADFARRAPILDTAFRFTKDLSSRTGFLLFDDAKATGMGTTNLVRQDLSDFEKASVAVFKRKRSELGDDKLGQLIADVTDEMEMGLRTKDEAEALAAANLQDPFGALTQGLYTPSAADTQRLARLSSHPEMVDMIDSMRGTMSEYVEMYKNRRIPMDELNPFGKGWARKYLKHRITTEFADKMKEINSAEDAFTGALEYLSNKIGGVDNSALGRKYRGTIRAANEKSLEEYGLKMFVDDPIELYSARINEMQKVISNFDLMASAENYARLKNPGIGWIKYNPDDFRKLVLDVSADKADQWKVMVPEVFRGDRDVYLPEEIYDKMNFWINGWNVPGAAVPLVNAIHTVDRVFRNNALFGLGYLGQNAIGNSLTYLMSADYKAPQALAEAMAAFVNPAYKVSVKNSDGLSMVLSGDQLFREAIEDGVLKNSVAKELSFDHLADYVASNRQSRKNTFWNKTADLADFWLGWKLNREVARVSDEIPKFAQYISRRKMGFTRLGAAESAEQLYYNFGLVSKTQDAVRQTVPFSSFGMKTAESTWSMIKNGQVNRLAIPGKVNAALDGAFVPDPETRLTMDQYLPWYKQHAQHPIHGLLMPGMREVLAELPWAQSTLTSLFPESLNVHPIAKLIGIGLSSKAEDEDFGADYSNFWKASQLVANTFLPPPVLNSLTMAEINGAMDFGGFFRDQYLPSTSFDEEQKRHYLRNAEDFGKAMSKEYGDNWLYNIFVGVPLKEGGKGEGSEALAYEHAVRGEYIRRKFRQFALGSATLTKLDSNWAVNRKGIERQIKRKTSEMNKELNDAGYLFDLDKITQKQYDSKGENQDPRLAEIYSLNAKLEALDSYYNYVLQANEVVSKEHEGGVGTMDVIEMLFGGQTNPYEPIEHEQFELLDTKKTKANILIDMKKSREILKNQ